MGLKLFKKKTAQRRSTSERPPIPARPLHSNRRTIHHEFDLIEVAKAMKLVAIKVNPADLTQEYKDLHAAATAFSDDWDLVGKGDVTLTLSVKRSDEWQ